MYCTGKSCEPSQTDNEIPGTPATDPDGTSLFVIDEVYLGGTVPETVTIEDRLYRLITVDSILKRVVYRQVEKDC